MNDFLSSPLFTAVLAIAAVAIVGRFVYGFLNKPKPAGVFVKVTCSKCKWKGTVGKYNRKCPKCASTEVRDTA